MTDKLRELSREFQLHPKSLEAAENNRAVYLKDWAFHQGYCIMTMRIPPSKNKRKHRFYGQITANFKGRLLNDKYSFTEYEVVTYLCEWIIQKEKL